MKKYILSIVLIILVPRDCLRWIDISQDETDTWYDRIVFIGNRERVITTGVLISRTQLLTSFNPFRKMARNWWLKDDISIRILRSRFKRNPRQNEPDRVYEGYQILNVGIECAKQVVPIKETDIKPNQWFGPNPRHRRHSPLHDLMVMRMRHNITFLPDDRISSPNRTYFLLSRNRWKNEVIAGPLRTEMANLTNQTADFLGRSFSVVSTGCRTLKELWGGYDMLIVRHFSQLDDFQVDCDEWIPRYWGHFICVLDPEKYYSITSGSMLFWNGRLYGVGSFNLKKGFKSINVFTDVRYYSDLVRNSCTYHDGGPYWWSSVY